LAFIPCGWRGATIACGAATEDCVYLTSWKNTMTQRKTRDKYLLTIDIFAGNCNISGVGRLMDRLTGFLYTKTEQM
jgi:hypothetical protein